MIESRNPATGELVFATETAEPDEVDRAVARSAAAAPAWAAMRERERAAVLSRFAHLIERTHAISRT